MRRLSLALIAALALPALARAQPGGPPVPEPPPMPKDRPDESELSAKERKRRSTVVAKVGETTITVGDVEDSINAQSPFLRARYRDKAKLHQFVRNMIRFELLAQEAESRGYNDDRPVVRSRKKHMVQQLIRRKFDQKIDPQSISEDAIRSYYEKHREKYHRPKMLRASHILVESKSKAKELIEKAKKGDTATFRKLAREHSIDTETKMRGGDLRYFTEEGRPPRSEDAKVDEALVDAAFGLQEVGDVVDEPVKVDEHWSIVKLTGRRPAEHRSFEDVERSIRHKLWKRKRKKAIERFVDKLRKRFEPEIYQERMRPIRLDTSPDKAQPGFPERGTKKGGAKGGLPALELGEPSKGKEGSKRP